MLDLSTLALLVFTDVASPEAPLSCARTIPAMDTNKTSSAVTLSSHVFVAFFQNDLRNRVRSVVVLDCNVRSEGRY